MSMFKLRNTWVPYFPGKLLHELDCSVHKRDSGWPVTDPPPSPSIHINPKFLSKVRTYSWRGGGAPGPAKCTAKPANPTLDLLQYKL